MKKVAKFIASSLVLLLAMGTMVGCGTQSTNTGAKTDSKAQDQQAGPAKKVSLRVGTAGTGGAFYPIGGALAKVLSQIPNVSATAEVTGGSVENIRRMGMKEMDLGFTMGDATWEGYSGTGSQFSKTGAVKNIRVLTNIYSNAVHFVTLKGSGITTIEGLKGKRVAVGSPGSGTELKAKALLEVAGITYKDIKPEFIDFNEAADGMKDKQIDAAVISVGMPGAAIIDLATAKDIFLIPVTDDFVAKVNKAFPYYVKGVIPKGTYPKQDVDVPALFIKGQILIREDLPEDLVYTMTKYMFEHLTDWTKVHEAAKEITLEGAAPGPIPMHPGAEKYYKEKGVLK